MHFSFPRRVGVKHARALALSALAACAATPVLAQSQPTHNTIFPAGWDSKVRDRLFMRIGYVSVITKTKSEDARDLSGFAVSRQDIIDASQLGVLCSTDPTNPRVAGLNCARYDDGLGGGLWEPFVPDRVLRSGLDADGVAGIGTPPGVKARAQKNIGTPALSIGYWLDAERKWLLEGFVLAAPLKVDIKGEGTNPSGQPNGVNGKTIATTKLLPPLVIGSYNFGEAEAMFRPYVGVGAMYAVFFGAKATPELETYVGGPTTITTKNTFGFGPFLGLKTTISDGWRHGIRPNTINLVRD